MRLYKITKDRLESVQEISLAKEKLFLSMGIYSGC